MTSFDNVGDEAAAGTRGERLAQEIGISKEHEGDMEDIVTYMEEHRIQELFNEILTRVLDERPQNAKYSICEYLKQVQKQPQTDPHSQRVYQFQDSKGECETYLNQDDFESLFDSYDVLGIQSVPVKYLCQAMKVVGIEDPEQILQDRYKELMKDEYVNKVSFVFVLREEHNRLGYSYKPIK